MRKAEEFKLRCTADEKARWQQAAAEQAVSLSELIRVMMNASLIPVGVEKGLEHLFDEQYLPAVGDASTPAEILREVLVTGEPFVSSRRSTPCPCGKPAWLYCRVCDAAS